MGEREGDMREREGDMGEREGKGRFRMSVSRRCR